MKEDAKPAKTKLNVKIRRLEKLETTDDRPPNG